MACLATLQSTVEKPKEIEESSDDDSLDGKWTFIPFIIFYFVSILKLHIRFNVAMMVEYPQFFIIQETKRSLSSYQMNIRFLYSWRTIYLSVMQRSLMQT